MPAPAKGGPQRYSRRLGRLLFACRLLLLLLLLLLRWRRRGPRDRVAPRILIHFLPLAHVVGAGLETRLFLPAATRPAPRQLTAKLTLVSK